MKSTFLIQSSELLSIFSVQEKEIIIDIGACASCDHVPQDHARKVKQRYSARAVDAHRSRRHGDLEGEQEGVCPAAGCSNV